MEATVEEAIVDSDGLTEEQSAEVRKRWVKAEESEQGAWLRRASALLGNGLMTKPASSTAEMSTLVGTLYRALVQVREAISAQHEYDYQRVVEDVRKGK